MRILGLDVGKKRVGVAISDPLGIIASPLTVINRRTIDRETICELISQYNVERIVVGLPLSLDGSVGKQAQEVQSFTQRLSQWTEVPIEYWDERLTTVAAERMMVDAGVGTVGRKAQRDAAAAAFILQGYLERVNPSRADE